MSPSKKYETSSFENELRNNKTFFLVLMTSKIIEVKEKYSIVSRCHVGKKRPDSNSLIPKNFYSSNNTL